MVTAYEYRVIELREGLLGGKMSGGKLEKILNEHADQGWQLKAITAVEGRFSQWKHPPRRVRRIARRVSSSCGSYGAGR